MADGLPYQCQLEGKASMYIYWLITGIHSCLCDQCWIDFKAKFTFEEWNSP